MSRVATIKKAITLTVYLATVPSLTHVTNFNSVTIPDKKFFNFPNILNIILGRATRIRT